MVRYEQEHSMSLWRADWKQFDSGEWWIAYEDDASRPITGYGVFQEATAEHTIQSWSKPSPSADAHVKYS
jgi:hypothetical protein